MDPGKFAKFAIFRDSRFKILGKISWIQALADMGPWMTVKAWIQEVSLRILKLESRKVCKVCKLFEFKIQDSRSREELLVSKHDSQGLDSRSFSQNLESWIQESLQSLRVFGIQDSRFWEKLLESKRWLTWGPGWQSRPGFRKFLPESWILNPGKFAKLAIF